MGVSAKLNADKFIDFLKRLLTGSSQPIFLVVDGHPVHRSAKVRRFAEQTNGKLELYFLPGYSPELNPTEHVWSQLKHHTVGKQTVHGPDQLRELVLSAMRRIQRLPKLVRAFFQAPDTCYAALS